MGKVKIKSEFYKKMEKEAKGICESLAKETSEKLENEYLDIVDNFYKEYTPEYYVRHHERGNYPERGLDRTYEKIYKKQKGIDKTTYKGGIRITTKNMYDGYRGTHEQVLDSFLAGFHGLPTWHGFENQYPPIRSNMIPQRELLDYLENELEPEMRKRFKFK